MSEGRLHTVREIARGGLGFVELVIRREGRFERVCAVKRPHTHLLGDSKMVEAFLEEGRIAGLLRHPNVVPVLDVGEDERGPFLLMDFVEGISVSLLIRHVGQQNDLLPLSVALNVAAQAAEGLRAAHELVGVDGRPSPMVHRDISPQNLLVGYDGIVRVVDFGIAKVLTGESPETTAAVLKGKTGYMAPEQLRFEHLDGRADIFALGVTLFEALSGRRLYHGGGIETVAQRILNEPPPDLTDFRGDATPALEKLLYDMLAKERNHRIASAAELVARIAEVADEIREVDEWVELAAYMDEEHGARRDAERAQRALDIEEARHRPTPTQIERRRTRLRGLAAAAIVLLGAGGAVVAISEPGTPVVDAPKPTVVDTPSPPPMAPVVVPVSPPEIVPMTEVAAPSRMRRRRRVPMRRRGMTSEMTAMSGAMSAASMTPSAMGLDSEFWD
ncbi:MAG: serine/threonine-protein kinase [Myxococcota bacterium]